MNISSCQWPACCYNPTVSKILTLFKCTWLPVTLRSPLPLTTMSKLQAVCAFQFTCKHTLAKHTIFPELWVLQKFKKAKVTFSLIQGHWQWCHMIAYRLYFLLVFHCNYVCLAPFPRYYYFPKFKEVTWRCPLEGLFINLKANTPHGQPAYKLWSL